MSDLKTILCVDDDDIARTAIHRFAESAGNYRVKSVPDGYECLKFLRRNNVDLVLLDYKLTDSDGLGICKIIPSISVNPDVPVIIISVTDRQYIKNKVDCKNIVSVVQKPYELNKLQQDCNEILMGS